MIDYPVRLSTTEPNNPVGVLKIRQDDNGTQKIVARITTNSKPQDLTGLEVAFNMRTTDGNVVIEKAVIKDVKLGIIEYVVSGFATKKAGRNTAYFTFFIGEDEQFSTKDFSYFVTNSVTSEGIRGCDYIWKFEDLLEFVTDLANQSQIQLNKLTSDVEVIQKQIDDMFALIAAQGVLTADEVRQLMINFMSGEDIELTVTSDFNTPPKVMGSIVENGNIARRYVGAAIPPSPPTGFEYGTQAAYDAIKKLEGTLSTQSTYPGVNALIPCHVIQFNVLWILEQNFPSLFKNATTIAEKVAIVQNKISAMTYTINGKGSGPSSTSTTMAVWQNTIWTGNVTKTGTMIQEFKQTPSQYSNKIDSNGLVNLIFYSAASDETTASSVSIDYASIDLTVKFNINDFIVTKDVLNERGIVSVKDFGAVGNGVANDTVAIQKAIDFVSLLGGGDVIFPSGTYMVKDYLFAKSNVNLIGHNATFVYTDTLTGADTLGIVYLSNSTGYGGGITNVLVEGIRFKGDFSKNDKGYIQAMHHASNITYRNCTFEEVLTRNHIFDLCGSENITIDNCTFIGFNPVSGREYVEAIQTDYSWYAGLSYKSESERNVVDGLPTRNVRVINCRFLPVYNADKTIKYVAPNPLGTHSQIGEIMMENITFSNNTVIDGYTGIEAKGLITFYGISNLVIENNLFTRTRDAAVNDNQAINVLMIREVVNPADVKLNSPSTITMTKGYINNIRIDNNEFSNFTSTGNKDLIEISGMNRVIDSKIGTAIYNAEGIILTRNKFENNYPASANPTSQKYGRGSINVKVCYSIITGNTFKKCLRAVHCEFGKITISNNDVSDVFYVPIVVSSAISDISSNLFNYVISGIYITFYSVSDPSNSTISNNVFYSIYPNDLGFPTDYAGATISAIGSGKVSINGNLLTGNSQVANGIRTNNFNGKGIAANNVVSGYVTQLNLGSNVTNANNVI